MLVLGQNIRVQATIQVLVNGYVALFYYQRILKPFQAI